MEYFRSGAGGASWATGIVVGVVIMLVVVLLGTWSSTEFAMMSMFDCNVGVIILLNFFLITVVHCGGRMPLTQHIAASPMLYRFWVSDNFLLKKASGLLF